MQLSIVSICGFCIHGFNQLWLNESWPTTWMWSLWILKCHCTMPLYWIRQWHPTPVLVPGKSHERRSLVGCSPWGREELDMTEWLHFDFSLSCIGEGNGNSLQYSCLENPRDGGAWRAAVYRVAQSWTWLKRLSSSSSSSSNMPLYMKDLIIHRWFWCLWESWNQFTPLPQTEGLPCYSLQGTNIF